jgi:hypothetical protein
MRDTIDMAREAGVYKDCDWRYEMKAEGDSLKAFEALVRADERKNMQAPTGQNQKSCKLCTHEQRHYMEMTGPCRACRFYSNFASATPPAAPAPEKGQP